jgi:hypothetical protein
MRRLAREAGGDSGSNRRGAERDGMQLPARLLVAPVDLTSDVAFWLPFNDTWIHCAGMSILYCQALLSGRCDKLKEPGPNNIPSGS